ASLKKFMDYIQTSAVDKMAKFLDKGLDPNYQDPDTGGEESCTADVYFISFTNSYT
ncbi:SH3 and multiple ankyrin repeat domains protein 3, partial [Goodea atripinnis]